MECEELHDALNNSELSEQEIPLEDFGDCELKSKLYLMMLKLFTKNLQKMKALEFISVQVKRHPKVIM